MASHNDNHNAHATVISPDRKSDLGFAKHFLEDVIPQKKDGDTASPSSNNARNLGAPNANAGNTTKILESVQ